MLWCHFNIARRFHLELPVLVSFQSAFLSRIALKNRSLARLSEARGRNRRNVLTHFSFPFRTSETRKAILNECAAHEIENRARLTYNSRVSRGMPTFFDIALSTARPLALPIKRPRSGEHGRNFKIKSWLFARGSRASRSSISPPPATPIRLLIGRNSIKLVFIFARLASTCPYARALARARPAPIRRDRVASPTKRIFARASR